MSDDPNSPVEVDEAIESPAVQERPDSSPEGDVERLTRALEHEREERRAAKEELRRLNEDEDARHEFLAKHGYSIEGAQGEEEPDDDYEDDDPYSQKLSQHDQQLQEFAEWKQQQDQEKLDHARRVDWGGWEEHVKGLAAESGVELNERDLKNLRIDCVDEKKDYFPVAPEDATKALNEYLAWRGDLSKADIERLKSSKRAPHTPTGGTAGKGPQPDMSTEEGRKQFYEQRLAGA